MQDAIKGLGDFKRGFDDLKKIADYRNSVMSRLGRLSDAAVVGRFEAAFRKRDAEIAAAALSEFKKKLAGLPVDPESVKVAKLAVNDLLAPRARSYRTARRRWLGPKAQE